MLLCLKRAVTAIAAPLWAGQLPLVSYLATVAAVLWVRPGWSTHLAGVLLGGTTAAGSDVQGLM